MSDMYMYMYHMYMYTYCYYSIGSCDATYTALVPVGAYRDLSVKFYH